MVQTGRIGSGHSNTRSGRCYKGGVKAIGTELVEEGIELAAKDAAKIAAKEIVEEKAFQHSYETLEGKFVSVVKMQ